MQVTISDSDFSIVRAEDWIIIHVLAQLCDLVELSQMLPIGWPTSRNTSIFPWPVKHSSNMLYHWHGMLALVMTCWMLLHKVWNRLTFRRNTSIFPWRGKPSGNILRLFSWNSQQCWLHAYVQWLTVICSLGSYTDSWHYIS